MPDIVGDYPDHSDDYPTEDPYFDEDIPEDEEEVDEGRCSDPNCETCYPDNEPESEVPHWTFPTTSSGNININFTSDTTNVSDNVRRSMEQIRSVIAEGDEMPETPEVVSGETPEVDPNVIYVPSINRLYFSSPGGSSLRPERDGRTASVITPGCTAQVSFWDTTASGTRTAFREFKAWLEENNLGFSSTSTDYFEEANIRASIHYYFVLCNPDHRSYIDPNEFLSQPPCGDCGEELDYPTLKCPNCDELTYCPPCRMFSTGINRDTDYGQFCDECGIQCPTCSNNHHRDQGQCPSCHPSQNCHSCGTRMYDGQDEIHTHEWPATHALRNATLNYCDICYPNLCHTCRMVQADGQIIVDEGHQCVTCISRNSSEEWDESSSTNDLLIPTIPGREVIRLVGVEIEGANGEDMAGRDGGNILARALYDEGLSRSYEMNGYHSGGSHGYKVHVERDSSVDWEMVIGPLNVAEEGDVELLNRSVRTVRNFINDGTLKLDMRAGLHVHVGADKVPFHSAYNLHKLYMYMEDFLYRFGAAKWPYHRSINRRGRDQAGKSPIAEGKLQFAQTFSGQRYYGLSFDNYFSRYFNDCSCGARTYGLFDECICDLGKCTFEFRLFNTTANTIKLHAYLAICQALVAKAIEIDEITDREMYPALDFVKSRVPDLHPSTRRKMGREWEKRIVFVNEQLPLTQEEKKSIHYCIMNSELGKIVTNADILLETEEI